MSGSVSSKKTSSCCLPLFSSPIGRKWIVALTGIILILFVIAHLLGNLSILGALLWVARIGLLLAVFLHIWFTISLWRENLAARPQKYAVKNDLQTTVYARLMRLSGLVVLAFVLFHLAEFTWQAFTPEYKTWVDAQGRHDVYRMVIAGFSSPFVTCFYLLAIGLLAMHLSHGIASLFQTLGITTAKMRPLFEKGGRAIAWIIFAGYVSIPLAVFFGILRYPAAACSLCR